MGNEKVLVVKTPNNLIAKLAEMRKELPKLIEDPPPKTDEEKQEARKKLRTKFQNESRITDKIVSMTLDSVFFDAAWGEELINKLLEEEKKEEEDEKKMEACAVSKLTEEDAIGEEDHDKLDFEVDEEMEKL